VFCPAVQQRMQHWQQDKDFAGVRGPEALAKLSEDEGKEWVRGGDTAQASGGIGRDAAARARAGAAASG